MLRLFQSTLPREERLCISRNAQPHVVFQSTLPREERRRNCAFHSGRKGNFNPRSHERSDAAAVQGTCPFGNFNPRSHERSDIVTRSRSLFWLISIHAPTRGATILHRALSIFLRFQSTLPREERPASATFCQQIQDFNPRSHERSDAFRSVLLRYGLYFNPRSHERSDAFRLQNRIESSNFNPRSHERSD